MFRNGIYKVFYRSPSDQEGFSEHCLAVLRDGHIIGADRLGGVFTGSPAINPSSGDNIHVDLSVPPGGELVTGLVAGPAGSLIKIKTRLDPEKIAQFATIDIAGEPVEIELIYMGPVPE
jgi:hypothetical protein